MRIEIIELHDHLSHASTRLELNGARLATISGPNGAGKSALLESIKYVLFDDGRSKGDDLVRLGATDMSASVTFTLNGSRYRATRGRTRRSGGHSNLDLVMETPDGTWRPLTGDDIRSTQARIIELLGMDASTFATSVFLGQGEANRFADSTPAERKRVLGQVLGLDIYARAEARARELARDLDARTAVHTDRIERLADAIAELEPSRELVASRQHLIHAIARDQTAAAAERDRIQGRLTELAGSLAAGEAAEADVTRLEGERAGLADRYRREQKTIADAASARDAAAATLASAGDLDQAIAELPTMRLEIESLEAAARQDDELATQARAKLEAIAALERPYERQHAAWEAQHVAAAEKVAELVEHGRAGTSVCQACGQPIERKTALEQLSAARAALAELDNARPVAPLAIDREKAGLERIRQRQTALDWDPGVLPSARRRLAELERTAARGEAIAAARATLEASKTQAAEATAELAKVTTAGEALAQQLTAAKAKVAGLAPLRAERDRMQAELAAQAERIRTLERDRNEAERLLAAAEANLARLEELIAERDALNAQVHGAIAELAILRQLVTAFGVTGIPARIIESVIPELEAYAAELLEQLRPGMTLSIRAQRAKKDGKGLIEALDLVVCDAAGERPLAMFSGGERMSVSLAIAVALSRLVARRAGAAIRSLVVDEPDGLDADARRAFGQALRVLAHDGELERVVLVSHHEDLAEYGDAIYRVTKDDAGSRVEQV